jgi:hypothetical protein
LDNVHQLKRSLPWANILAYQRGISNKNIGLLAFPFGQIETHLL